MSSTNPTRKGLLKFHRPLEGSSLANLKPESRQCLQNLAAYMAPTSNLRFPKSRSAAVLIALFIGRMGDLYVLLSRRASTMRSYAGDTSLPGGKWERGDRNMEFTARREAFEEIGLPMDRRKVPLLCILEPFLAGNQLVVTPVVVLVLDKTIQPILNESEVHSLFSHPLISFLRSDPPFPSDPDTFELPYHTHVDIKWSGFPSRVRMHRFLTGREAGGTKPIFGLTAAILIRTAMIGYASAPSYELEVPGQPSHTQRIEHSLKHHPVFREASLKEGLISAKKLSGYEVPDDQRKRRPPSMTSAPTHSATTTSLSQPQIPAQSDQPSTSLPNGQKHRDLPSSSSCPRSIDPRQRGPIGGKDTDGAAEAETKEVQAEDRSSSKRIRSRL